MSLSSASAIFPSSTRALTAQRVRSFSEKLRVRVYPELKGGFGGVKVTSAVLVSSPASRAFWALAA